MRTFISILLLLGLAACSTSPSKAELDAEVKRLCAIDGGIKVYETVRLPPEKFNQWGQIDFYKPVQGENALGIEYLFKTERKYYQQGNPQMSRWHFLVIRRADDRLLGEAISYWRGGGDMQGPWHGSSFHCPQTATENQLLMEIFVKTDKEDQK